MDDKERIVYDSNDVLRNCQRQARWGIKINDEVYGVELEWRKTVEKEKEWWLPWKKKIKKRTREWVNFKKNGWRRREMEWRKWRRR